MTPQQYERLTELCHAVLEIAPDQRAAFLDQVSDGDADLRRELESLLAAHEQRAAYTEKPPDDIAAGMFLAQHDIGAAASLPPNTRIDRYEIRSLLGKGGMGEVYLAEDLRLHRKVALKILPAEVAADRDRMRRFEQEATAAAALNHPHIAHIYEIGESEGIHFIAMEHIDGDTLRDKIHRDKAPLQKLLKYLTQVAEGLTKAHAADIVHRDLKPDNIMITRDDYAKILDFGLAKLVETQRSLGLGSAASSEVGTRIMAQQSLAGMVMGTAGYMSPEQAQGKVKEIDQRSDIFSFGCILFEAATGHKPFEGQDLLDSLHKIVHGPTPQIKETNANAPHELQRIVRRCLAKEPEKRYQSIKEVAIELDEIRQELKDKAMLEYSVQPEAIEMFGVPPSGAFVTDTRKGLSTGAMPNPSSAEYLVSGIRSHKKSIGVIVLALLAVTSGIVFALYKFLGKADKPPQTIKLEKLTTNGRSSDAAISPDGKYVVYIFKEGGQQSLWTRQVATTSNVQIIPSADVQYLGLVFSPDGNYINFVKREKRDELPALYQMPVLGGAKKKLTSDINGAVSYSPDGKEFAYVRGSFPTADEDSLLIANSDGTGERILVSLKRPEEFRSGSGRHPVWSPDGKTIACIVASGGSGDNWKVVEVQVGDGTVKPVAPQGWNDIRRIAWLPDKSGLLVLGADKISALNSQI